MEAPGRRAVGADTLPISLVCAQNKAGKQLLRSINEGCAGNLYGFGTLDRSDFRFLWRIICVRGPDLYDAASLLSVFDLT